MSLALASGPDGSLPVPAPASLRQRLRDLLELTKYRITFTALFTGYTAIAIHGEHATDWGFIAPCLLALFLLGGAANTLNQVFDRRRDAVMERTRVKRPVAAGRVSPAFAATFAVLQFLAAELLFIGAYGSWLAAGLALFTLLYYSFFYTLWLKPRHWLNIVVGGVPGAMGPVLAWAAVAGEVSAAALALFALIFLWTPPHVWALAIRLKEDYARIGIPMLPVVRGDDETTRQIFLYTAVMVAFSLALPLVPPFGRAWAYLASAAVLGGVFLAWAWHLWRHRPMPASMPLFRFSIVYIMVLFSALILDGLRLREAA